jgi:hypothetical protein
MPSDFISRRRQSRIRDAELSRSAHESAVDVIFGEDAGEEAVGRAFVG